MADTASLCEVRSILDAPPPYTPASPPSYSPTYRRRSSLFKRRPSSSSSSSSQPLPGVPEGGPGDSAPRKILVPENHLARRSLIITDGAQVPRGGCVVLVVSLYWVKFMQPDGKTPSQIVSLANSSSFGLDAPHA
ncbi:hypothetical protein LTR28_001083, partial [Elasticomyces elasticus]